MVWVSIFLELFSPGGRHRVDEQERLEHTREVEGVSVPGRGPIDLGSGVVLIKPSASLPSRREEEAEGDTDAEGDGDEV